MRLRLFYIGLLLTLVVAQTGCLDGRSPSAEFTATQKTDPYPMWVDFKALHTEAPNGSPIISYEWDFDGDGNIDRITGTPTTSYDYNYNKRYRATLTVTDDGGQTDTRSTEIVVNIPPFAIISSPCRTATTDESIHFSAGASYDDDGSIVTYVWNFGDGQTRTSASSTATHTYTEVGSYPLTVTVIDDLGATDMDECYVKVEDCNCG